MKRWLFILLVGILAACANQPPLNVEYKDALDKSHTPAEYLESNDGLVLLFLSPECPLCQNYAVAMRELRKAYSEKNIRFLGVISGDYYAKEEVHDYQVQYDLEMEMLFDPDFKLAHYYGATATPEAVLTDKNGKLLYRGAIDNWAISLGRKRLEASAHYLRDAMEDFLSGNKIDPKETKPVGCFIE